MNYYDIAKYFLIRFLVVCLIFKYRLKFLKGLLYAAAGVLLILGAFVYNDEYDEYDEFDEFDEFD